MLISVFDLFTIGIGPSSSHTVGPMRAARRFVEELRAAGGLDRVDSLKVTLYGSLAWTGIGHGTDRAILLGLEGESPEEVDVDTIGARVEQIRDQRSLRLGGERVVDFDPDADLVFEREAMLPHHSNGMRFVAADADGAELLALELYSIGGGFVVSESHFTQATEEVVTEARGELPFDYRHGADILRMARESGLSLSEMTLRNELTQRSREEVFARLLRIWEVFQECVERGCRSREAVLPGGLDVTRRAPALHRRLRERERLGDAVPDDPLTVIDWVDLYALAIGEENAAGGRVVTAPTNGAAGIVPAVLHYFARHCEAATQERIARFLLTAGAIGIIYKLNASLSGAEVGCQGEVGVACSMAAGALTEALGGSVAQVEQAAEIGMEHNLGLTCDPVGGLVQIPCIERNAMGAVKAINAARLALRSDGTHRISLDKVVETMRQTGLDMSSKYKETARGGLAVNVAEC